MDLHPGLNVFVGRNAQGKTSLLEAVGLLARGRSFRTEDTKALIRRGASGARRASVGIRRRRATTALEVELERGGLPALPGRRPGSARPASTTAAWKWSCTPPTACGSCAGPCATGGSSSTGGPPRSGRPTGKRCASSSACCRSATPPSRTAGATSRPGTSVSSTWARACEPVGPPTSSVCAAPSRLHPSSVPRARPTT